MLSSTSAAGGASATCNLGFAPTSIFFAWSCRSTRPVLGSALSGNGPCRGVAPRAPSTSGTCGAVCASATSRRRKFGEMAPAFTYPSEHNFNLAEYLVCLEKPLGLTLAPDPITGQIVVQSIMDGSPAALSRMIQVGDVVKMCSAVFGEDMWQALDIRRVRWAINNRTTPVKLVLERAKYPAPEPTWYSKGKLGSASYDRDTLQLPVAFNSASPEDWSLERAAVGRPMFVAFHRSVLGTSQAAQQRNTNVAAARSARLQALRGDLAEARREPEMDLGSAHHARSAVGLSSASMDLPFPPASMQPPRRGSGSTQGGSSSSAAGPQAGASGAKGSGSGAGQGPLDRFVSSMVGSAGGLVGAGASQGQQQEKQGQAQSKRQPRHPKEKKVTPVLPWLLVTSTRLDTRDLTHIASYRGLSALLELGLTLSSGALAVRGSELPPPSAAEVSGGAMMGMAQGAGGRGPAVWGAGTGAVASGLPQGTVVQAGSALPIGSPVPPSPKQRLRSLINAAAALQRLAVRRRHGTLHHAPPEATSVLLHCESGMDVDVAALLAGWLHWYNRMPLQEALLSAEIAMGCSIEPGVLEAATEELVESAEERNKKVVLSWRYGGLSVFVAGDIVGGWANRTPLLRCKNPLGCKGLTARGNFFLELAGLRPGMYYYKYIVDGTWTVDPVAPKVLDASGNWNNVLEVHERPPIGTSRERLSMARWQALLLAMETKLGLPMLN